MANGLKLMCVLAHPDDESLGLGGVLAKYAAEGVETYVVTATRGERGRFGTAAQRPAPEVVGRVREEELRAAARELGVREVAFLDYVDGELDRVDWREAVSKIVYHLRRVRPQVVITFGPEGGYGHPDHIAISQLATAAVVCAADPSFEVRDREGAPQQAHRVLKLYYSATRRQKWEAVEKALRRIRITVDGVERGPAPWPDWAVTTVVDASNYWETAWRAILCHKTQMAIYVGVERLSEEEHKALWGTQEFYRAFSTVNGGRELETDLFAGLRPA
jgi:LmbE family N-acetylglucosaminyl deacetylase